MIMPLQLSLSPSLCPSAPSLSRWSEMLRSQEEDWCQTDGNLRLVWLQHHKLQSLMAVTYKKAVRSRSHAEFGSEVELGFASV